MRLPRAIAACAWLCGAAACGEPTPADPCAVTLDGAPLRGPADAWVTMVEFADFECPYCERAKATVEQLLALYPATLRHVYKHLPLSYHARAMDAAVAAQCAHAQDRFWPMHDLLYENRSELDDADLERWASQAGVELSAWRTCLGSAAGRDPVRRDQREAGRAGASGTPTFFVNHRLVVGAQPLDVFGRAIDAEITAAEASGIAAADYYALGVRRECH